jgi:hypothetical protein
MELKILRTKFYDNRTIGQLYINEDFFCFTLEDKMREVQGQPVEKWKVKEETAIPQGRYRVQLQVSLRFGPDTISVLSVPGFVGVRVHSGNTDKDTEGCPLLGYKLTDKDIIQYGTTKPAVADLKLKIKEAINNKEEVWITVVNNKK